MCHKLLCCNEVSLKDTICSVLLVNGYTNIAKTVMLKAESEPELHSHIVTCIVPPAGRDKTMRIKPHRYCGKKNVASKRCVYSQS